MVKIIDYSNSISSNGSSFYSLRVQGGVEMIKSKETGRYYASAKKAFISSTFDEQTCKALIGTEIPGSVKKEYCEPFEYTVKETGEIIELSHKYVFVPEEEQEEKQEGKVFPKSLLKHMETEGSFSLNGQSLELV